MKKDQKMGKVVTEDKKSPFEKICKITLEVNVTNKMLLAMHTELVTGNTGGKKPINFRLIQSVGGEGFMLYCGTRTISLSSKELCTKLIDLALAEGAVANE